MNVTSSGWLTMERCQVTASIAERGGGIYCRGRLIMTDCLVTDNTVFGSLTKGAGLYFDGDTANITDCTVCHY